MLGNLHLNVIAEKYSTEVEAALEPYVYELVGRYSASGLLRPLLTTSFRVIPRFHFSRARNWSDEGSCITLLKEPREHCPDAQDQEVAG